MWLLNFVVMVIASTILCLSPSFATEELVALIIGGTNTDIERYPYTVQIYRNSDFKCGGSLISHRHVLSAAHCFFKNNGIISPVHFTVRAGTSKLNTGGTEVAVYQIIVPDRYNPKISDNDLAVLVLCSKLATSASIGIVTIPRQGYEVPDNSAVTYVGWGSTSVQISQPSQILQSVTVFTVSRHVCAERYARQEVSSGRVMVVTHNMICAGLLDIGGKDACQWDSGGPLLFNNTLVGIISWGYQCAHSNFPGVATRVSSFYRWIHETMANYNADELIGVCTSQKSAAGRNPMNCRGRLYLTYLLIIYSLIFK
ncbi:trypsin CFT-1-like [Achroia grisella]|uniref:trypsin CFT-1-like n=1 Tax=Achroia grisella TaxID=688607 RepID=UPI0027D30835|nr:trypsin CFT-1-like [Achroia grisella]